MPWFWIVSWFLIVIAIFGNALVTYLIITRRRLHIKSNWYVLSFAVADLILVVLLTLPIYFCGTLIRNCSDAIVHSTTYFGKASVTNIIALTVDRYCAIVLPLRYTQIMTEKKIVVILITSWLAPLILDTVPSVLLPKVLSNGEEIAQLTSMVIFQISPCFFLTIAAIKMITIANKHARRTSVLLKQLRFNQPTNRAKAETSSARVISVMVGIFLMCYVSQSLSSLCSCFSSCKKAQFLSTITILVHLSYKYMSLTVNGSDENGLKLENIREVLPFWKKASMICSLCQIACNIFLLVL